MSPCRSPSRTTSSAPRGSEQGKSWRLASLFPVTAVWRFSGVGSAPGSPSDAAWPAPERRRGAMRKRIAPLTNAAAWAPRSQASSRTDTAPEPHRDPLLRSAWRERICDQADTKRGGTNDRHPSRDNTDGRDKSDSILRRKAHADVRGKNSIASPPYSLRMNMTNLRMKRMPDRESTSRTSDRTLPQGKIQTRRPDDRTKNRPRRRLINESPRSPISRRGKLYCLTFRFAIASRAPAEGRRTSRYPSN